MRRKVNFGVVGCGVICSTHLEGIFKSTNANLVAVCDINKKVADDVSRKYGVKKYYSIQEMVKDEDIEVINICTPSYLHYEQAILAAKHHKHILVEKPMAIHLEHIDAIIKTCKDYDVLLGTIFPRRMSPQAQFIKKALDNKELGELSLCSAYVKIYRSQEYYNSAGWRGTWEYDGGGAMMNQGIHTVDLLQWLAGTVKSVYGKTAAILRDIEVEDTGISLLEFKNGAIGTMEITTTASINEAQKVEIFGERGAIVIEDDDIAVFEIDGAKVDLPKFEEFKVLPDGHRIQIEDFAQAVLEDRLPVLVGEDSKHSLEIILGTYQSSQTGEKISLL